MKPIRVKNIIRYTTVWVARIALALMCTCSNSPVSDGGGTRGGNPVVTGKIVNSDGEPAGNVRVFLIDADYNPMKDPPLQPSSIVITDSSGSFSITAPDSGIYTIKAKDIYDGSCLVRFNLMIQLDSIYNLAADTLHAPGALKIWLTAKSDSNETYVYVPGSDIGMRLTGATDTITIDSIPSGTLPVLYYTTKNGTVKQAIQYNILIKPGETTMIGDIPPAEYRRIFLNTSLTGADVAVTISNFPVLLRLNKSNFTFSQIRSGGGDLFFTNQNGKSMPFEIVQWDSIGQRAVIWVKVDTIFGNDSTQSIIMHWGNPDSVSVSNSTAVFDTASGFQGVWHLEESDNSPALDATINDFHGTAYHMAGLADGAIGKARVFDGDSSCITIPNTSNSKLNYPEDGYYTVSAWVYADTMDKTTIP